MARSGVLAQVKTVDPVTVVIEGDPAGQAVPVQSTTYSPAEGDVVSVLIRHPFAPQIQGKVGG